MRYLLTKRGIPIERPRIRGRLELSVGVDTSATGSTPLVTTLEEVTVKPPKSAPLLIALLKAEVASIAAVAEVEEPPVGSALPATATEPFLIDRMVINSTFSVFRRMALRKAIISWSMMLRTSTSSLALRVTTKPTFTLF